MQFHSQLITTNVNNLVIHPKALSAFQITAGSTYTFNTDNLKPLGKDISELSFEMPLVIEDGKNKYVIANWLYLQHQFQHLLPNSNEIPIVLLSDKPKCIESVSWQYAFHTISRSLNRHNVIPRLRGMMLSSPTRSFTSIFNVTGSATNKSTLEKICKFETRQSISTQTKDEV